MADTTFVAGTPIVKEWLNDINDVVYGLPDTSSAANGGGLMRASQSLVYTSGTMGAHYNDMVSLRDYPFLAVGDNVTDDTAAVQAAIDYCLANGKSLYVPKGKYRLTDQIDIALYSGIFERGLVIDGEGYGSRFVIDHTGTGFYVSCDPSFGIYQCTFRGIYFTDGTSSPDKIIHNVGAINTIIEKCIFHNATVTTGCVVNDLAYGLRLLECTFASIVGTGVVLNQQGDIGITYSFVNAIHNCDFSILTTGVEVQGCNVLSVINTVFEECDSAFVADPTVTLAQAWNMTFENCWFERNTTWDLQLSSDTNHWCEASIRNCQFSGIDPIYQCHIDLGAKSRVTIEGAPTGNTVLVSGSAAAAAMLIRATNFIQSGTFAWSSIDPVGNIVASTYKSISGVYASPASGAAVTLRAMENVSSSSWLVSAQLDGTGNATNNSCLGVLVTQGATSVYTAIKTASVLTVSTSGLNLQGTQTSGGVYSITWSLARLS